METIGIIGLGLIGGSLGLDFVQAGYRVLGVARRPETCQLARQRQVVHEASCDLDLLQTADLVFVCTPLKTIESTLAALVPWLQPGAVVTDVGSVKTPIVQACSCLWPNFVGGHPMAGKAQAGLEVAEPGLFAQCPYVLTPIASTPTAAVERVVRAVQLLQARLYRCSPDQHDRAVAWISHLPVMVSSSLLQACLQESDPTIQQLAQQLASSGFRDTSRVGGGVPELGTLMAQFNREALLSSLATYQGCLDQLQTLITTENWEGLTQYLTITQQARPDYVQESS